MIPTEQKNLLFTETKKEKHQVHQNVRKLWRSCQLFPIWNIWCYFNLKCIQTVFELHWSVNLNVSFLKSTCAWINGKTSMKRRTFVGGSRCDGAPEQRRDMNTVSYERWRSETDECVTLWQSEEMELRREDPRLSVVKKKKRREVRRGGGGGLRVHQEPTSASSIFLVYESDEAQRGVLIQ